MTMFMRSIMVVAGAGLMAQTANSEAACIFVNTTEFLNQQPNNNCSFYEAMFTADHITNGAPHDDSEDACRSVYVVGSGCPYSGDPTPIAIVLPAGVFSIQEGLLWPDVAGAGVENTFLFNDGLITPEAVRMGDTPGFSGIAYLRHLTVQGDTIPNPTPQTTVLVRPTTGVVVPHDNKAILDHVRVRGFNDGGIRIEGDVIVRFSTIEFNRNDDNPQDDLTPDNGFGGGIVIQDCNDNTFIFNSTIKDNRALRGGGIYVGHPHCNADVQSSTIARNEATAGPGGGIYVASTDPSMGGAGLIVGYTTIAGNHATQGGAGVFVTPVAQLEGTVRVNSSIIAQNLGTGIDYEGTLRNFFGFSDGFDRDIIGTVSNPGPGGLLLDCQRTTCLDPDTMLCNNGVTIEDPVVCDLVGTPLPLLAPLGNYGGPTETMPLRAGSRGVDQAQSPAEGGSPEFQRYGHGYMNDQRGNCVPRASVSITWEPDPALCDPPIAFPVPMDGNGNGLAGYDLGAVEQNAPGPFRSSLVITSDWGAGYCASLRFSNDGTSPVVGWTVAIDTNSTVIYNSWNAGFSPSSGVVTISNTQPWNRTIPAGAVNFDSQAGFCANRPGGGQAKPVVLGTSSPVVTLACANGVRDGNETDVDCGGAACMACPVGKACVGDADCASSNCSNKVCGTTQSAARYRFETDTMGWTHFDGPVAGTSTSTAQAYDGSHSLSVNVNGNGNPRVFVQPATPPAPGTTLTYRVFIPSNAPVATIQPYVASQTFQWSSSWNPITAGMKGSWRTFTVTFAQGSTTPAREVGMKVYLSAAYSGPIYIDGVTW